MPATKAMLPHHFRVVVLVPGTVMVVIPGVILHFAGPDTFGIWQSIPAIRFILPIFGVVFVGVGLLLMAATIQLFAVVGDGTLAPWNPPKHLVVQGVYRHVRNPMISGGMLILLGEAVAMASLPLFGLFMIFLIVNLLHIPLSEERGLAKRFGNDYAAYKQNVPRWIPTLRPWEGETSD